MSRYVNALQCTGLTKAGHPCKNHIIGGTVCWLHESHLTIPVRDPRPSNVVKAFKCPHCGNLTELVERYA